jgi:peptidoglycan LD-endopeptidase CwlK
MYQLGSQSNQRLLGVHPDLVRVVRRAIAITAQDFTVLEGVRTLERQREYVAKGASQTLDSRHLVGADGYGHAVDLAAYIGGVRWEWALYEPIADAMRRAAIDCNVPIRWGGGWFLLNDFATPGQVKRATAAYVDDRKASRKKAFLDGPHFELPKAVYP